MIESVKELEWFEKFAKREYSEFSNPVGASPDNTLKLCATIRALLEVAKGVTAIRVGYSTRQLITQISQVRDKINKLPSGLLEEVKPESEIDRNPKG